MADPSIGTRRCWHCKRETPILWDQRLNRAYCPHCCHTQPPRNNPNTVKQRVCWGLLRAQYAELEGVSLAMQRGSHKTGGKPDDDAV